MSAEAPRPAFYALAPGSWRDYVTLLHPPYTAWHLSYVAIGAALAADFRLSRLLPTLAAFFLAVGIGAHALDELHGRPLGTELGSGTLALLAALSIAGAVAIGVYTAVAWSPWIAVFAILGAFIVCAYNLELLGGRFHTDAWFALSWGAFPLVTGFFAVAETDHRWPRSRPVPSRLRSVWRSAVSRPRSVTCAGTSERYGGRSSGMTERAMRSMSRP